MNYKNKLIIYSHFKINQSNMNKWYNNLTMKLIGYKEYMLINKENMNKLF